MKEQICPCCSGSSYQVCCQPLHLGSVANTPEQLMRSRYSAFALTDIQYLLHTSSEQLRATLSHDDLDQTCEAFRFVSLQIISAQDNQVEFIANLLLANELHPLHETSTFIKQNAQWKYDTGVLHDTKVTKLSRNDKCPCGSGKKYKQCHMI